MKKNVGNVCVTVALVCLALVVVFAWLGCVENSTALLALSMALNKAGLAAPALDYIFAGDLLNQCIGTGFLYLFGKVYPFRIRIAVDAGYDGDVTLFFAFLD